MRWLFTPPLFADEEQTQTARQLYIILWTIILAVTVVMMLNIFILPEAIWRWVLTLGSVDATCLALLGLTRRGQMRLASKLMVLALWGIVTALASTAGGIHTPAVNGYLLIVFMAGLLLGARAGIFTAVGCSLTGLGLIYAARADILPPSVQYNEFAFWTTLTFFLVVIVGLQYLATDAIKKSLQRAQQELAERRQTETALRESEERYRSLFEGIPIGLYRSTPSGQLQNVNPALAQMLGYPNDEALLTTVNAADFYVDSAARQQFLMQLEREGQARDFEVQMRRRDGTLIWARLNSQAVRDDQGRLLYFEGSLEDITERKRAEELLRENEGRLRQITDNMVDLIAQFDAQAFFQYVSPSYEKILGYRSEELVGQWAPEFIHPDEKGEIIQAIDVMLRLGAGSVQLQYRHKDGSYRWFESTGRNLLNAEGQVIGSIMGSRDITDRKQAEESQREAQQLYENIFRLSPEVIVVTTEKEGRYLAANDAHERVTGYCPDEVIGHTLAEFIVWDSPTERQGIIQRLHEQGTVRNVEMRFRRRSGEPYTALLSMSLVEVRGERCLVSMITDITERKQAEAELAATQALLKSSIEQSPAPIVVAAPDGTVTIFNQACLDFLGIADEADIKPGINIFTMQRSWQDLDTEGQPIPPHEAPLSLALQGQATKGREMRVRRKDGAERWEMVDGVPIYDKDGKLIAGLIIFPDITTRKRAEEQIKTSLQEKEALIRELYHRTKNNMQVICAMLDLQSSYTANAQVTQVFEEMNNRIRSMSLVHQMLYQSQNLSSINLQEYISDLADLLMGSYNISPHKISLKLDLEDVFILIDMAVPCGLILNELISNALKYAFPGDRSGEITVRLRRRDADTIELNVADNGVGVPVGFDFRKHGKMGLQTILAVGERQLQGEIKFDSPPGFSCFIRFRDTLYSARV